MERYDRMRASESQVHFQSSLNRRTTPLTFYSHHENLHREHTSTLRGWRYHFWIAIYTERTPSSLSAFPVSLALPRSPHVRMASRSEGIYDRKEIAIPFSLVALTMWRICSRGLPFMHPFIHSLIHSSIYLLRRAVVAVSVSQTVISPRESCAAR